jgi:hypothetical protein
MNLIGMLKDEIQRNTQAVPVISPVVDKAGLPETLGATQMIQANASEPIKHDVKHSFEPAFEEMLYAMLRLYEDFLESAPAYQILGKEKAEQWEKEKNSTRVSNEDIILKETPTFIAKGVSVFSEKQVELEKLLRYFEVSLKANVPAIDPQDGTPMTDEQGKPIMVPKADVGEIMKRIAELMGFKNLEELLPYLRMRRLQSQGIQPKGSLPATPNSGAKGPVSPAGPLQSMNPTQQVMNKPTLDSGGASIADLSNQ